MHMYMFCRCICIGICMCILYRYMHCIHIYAVLSMPTHVFIPETHMRAYKCVHIHMCIYMSLYVCGNILNGLRIYTHTET